MSTERIGIDDYAFVVSKLILDCPPHTVVREILTNAIEAAIKQSPVGRIEWFQEEVGGVPKIGLYNEGPGMSADDLFKYTNVASSGKGIGMGINDHFGQGAKIAGLAASPAGLRYRSCKDGGVSEVMLFMNPNGGRSFSTAERTRELSEGGEFVSVFDASEPSRTKGRSLKKDWTEVLLLGKTPDHNTVKGLRYGEWEGVRWIMRAIHHRFYKFPDGVVVRNCSEPASEGESDRTSKGLLHLMNVWHEWKEVVEIQHPIYGVVEIHYYILKEASRRTSLAHYGMGNGSHVCLIWNNEIYFMSNPWKHWAPPCGIHAGRDNIVVHVVLPTDSPISPDANRTHLLVKDSNDLNREVCMDEFTQLVDDNRPEHLRKYIQEESERTTRSCNVHDYLMRYMKELKSPAEMREVTDGEGEDTGIHQEETGNGGESLNSKPRKEPRSYKPGRKAAHRFPDCPKVAFTTDAGWLSEIGDRAGAYDSTTHTLWLSENHSEYKNKLARVLNAAGIDPVKQDIYKKEFDDQYAISAGRFAVQSWYWRGKESWTNSDWLESLNKGSLTVYLTSPDIVKDTLHRANAKYKRGRQGVQ